MSARFELTILQSSSIQLSLYSRKKKQMCRVQGCGFGKGSKNQVAKCRITSFWRTALAIFKPLTEASENEHIYIVLARKIGFLHKMVIFQIFSEAQMELTPRLQLRPPIVTFWKKWLTKYSKPQYWKKISGKYCDFSKATRTHSCEFFIFFVYS